MFMRKMRANGYVDDMRVIIDDAMYVYADGAIVDARYARADERSAARASAIRQRCC